MGILKEIDLKFQEFRHQMETKYPIPIKRASIDVLELDIINMLLTMHPTYTYEDSEGWLYTLDKDPENTRLTVIISKKEGEDDKDRQ